MASKVEMDTDGVWCPSVLYELILEMEATDLIYLTWQGKPSVARIIVGA